MAQSDTLSPPDRSTTLQWRGMVVHSIECMAGVCHHPRSPHKEYLSCASSSARSWLVSSCPTFLKQTTLWIMDYFGVFLCMAGKLHGHFFLRNPQKSWIFPTGRIWNSLVVDLFFLPPDMISIWPRQGGLLASCSHPTNWIEVVLLLRSASIAIWYSLVSPNCACLNTLQMCQSSYVDVHVSDQRSSIT